MVKLGFCESIFRAEARGRVGAGIVPDVEACILAARKKALSMRDTQILQYARFRSRFLPPGWKSSSTAGKDAAATELNRTLRKGAFKDDSTGIPCNLRHIHSIQGVRFARLGCSDEKLMR